MSASSYVTAAALASSSLTVGQAQLVDYVQTWSGLPLETASTYALSMDLLTPALRCAVLKGEVEPSSAPLLAATTYVRSAQTYEGSLLASLGVEQNVAERLAERRSGFDDHFASAPYPWQSEGLGDSLYSQLQRLHETIGTALDKVREWKKITGFYPDAGAYLDAALELGGPLAGLQSLLVRRIKQAQFVASNYDLSSGAGLDVYFHRRKAPRESGPLPKLADGAVTLFDSVPPPSAG